jgi:hypothetical protein
MFHCCTCGLEFVIVPKEIPLNEPEALCCEDCGCEIRGPRCKRYADYVPLRKISPSSAADVSDVWLYCSSNRRRVVVR